MSLFWRATLSCFALASALSSESGDDDFDVRGKMAEILSELKAIHVLLEKGQSIRPIPSPHIVKVNVKDVPFLGSKDAPFAIAELTDYECTYCRQFYLENFQKVQQQMITTNKVRFYVKNLPLDIHPNALLAAQAASCAVDQGRFWEMHSRMQSAGGEMTLETLIDLGRRSEVDTEALRRCIVDKKYVARIQDGTREASDQGIQGTPAFILGKVRDGFIEGELVVGAAPVSVLEQKLEKAAPQL